MVMEHEQAIEIEAAERYVLGRLSAEEHEAYEEHFFSCQECAEEVRWVAIFNANARQVLSEQAPDVDAEIQAAAPSEPASLDEPQAYAAAWLTSGSAPIVELASAHAFFGLSLALPNPLYDTYLCRVTGPTGVEFSLVVLRSSDARLHLLVPARALAPGEYTLSVSGAVKAAETIRYPFTLKRR
jgi:hypothetical protein